MSKLYSGAEIVFKCLEDQGVEFIFGYPGGAVLPIYDELKNHKSIKHILAICPDSPQGLAEEFCKWLKSAVSLP